MKMRVAVCQIFFQHVSDFPDGLRCTLMSMRECEVSLESILMQDI